MLKRQKQILQSTITIRVDTLAEISQSTHLKMMFGLIMVSIVLVISMSHPIEHDRLRGALRVRLRLILVSTEVTGLGGFFSANAAVRIISLAELRVLCLLAPGWTLRVTPKSIGLSTSIIIRVLIRWALIILMWTHVNN